MNPATYENKRYRQADHCHIKTEELRIFRHIEKIFQQHPTNLKLLDIGCGSGRITKIIQDMGLQVKGIDISEVAVNKARQRGLTADVVDLDSGIPEPTAHYDIILAGDIIEHVFDPINVLKECHRVLKDDGTCLITTPHDLSIMVRLRALAGHSHQEIPYRRVGVAKHHTVFSWPLLKFMLQQAGFTSKEVTRVTNIGNLMKLTSPITPLIFTNGFIIAGRKSNRESTRLYKQVN